MNSIDDFLTNKNDYCFAKLNEIYAVYLKKGGNFTLNLINANGEFDVLLYKSSEEGVLKVGTLVKLGIPPADENLDWAWTKKLDTISYIFMVINITYIYYVIYQHWLAL